MALRGQNFTALEHAMLSAICKMHPADRTALEAQVSTATVRSRENTGGGFYTHFDLDRDSIAAIVGEHPKGGPEAKIGGLRSGMGFLLFVEEGYVSLLEGYS